MTPEAIARYKSKLREYLPEVSVDAVFDFMQANSVQMRITPERQSKLGDYRWPHAGHPYHEISINGNLQEQFFLLVLLHEMGHLSCWLKYRNKVQPHGHEWQEEYRQHLIQHLKLGAFDATAAPMLAKYVRRIPLNRTIGSQVEEYFRKLQPDFEESGLVLNDLEEGDRFVIKSRPDTIYIAGQKRRTRWLCRDARSGVQFLVNGSAVVIKM